MESEIERWRSEEKNEVNVYVDVCVRQGTVDKREEKRKVAQADSQTEK